MASKKATDLRAKTPDERKTMLLDLRREQLNLRFQRATQAEGSNPSRMREVRRDIARLKTILAEQQRSAAAK